MSRIVFGLAAMSFLSTSAFAIGTTHCASADGSIKRTEQEVWGANPVIWTYNDVKLAEAAVKIVDGTAKTIDLVIRQDTEMGEERTETTTMKVAFEVDGATVTDHVICKAVHYPNVLD